ncbi:hypothetical protein [Sphingomonas bacterium]|uniref:hypothetical protein n=1 Tax=Sphingomonas bacterium TaxID=1895847 RepID=UPI001575B94A|nr:hypothetical protein [Sphingomonas bacterium]
MRKAWLCVGLFTSLSGLASATTPAMLPNATADDCAVASKLSDAITHGDLRQASNLFSDGLEVAQDGLTLRSSKTASLNAMNDGYFGNWTKVTCAPVRIDRVAVSRFHIIVMATYPGGVACTYPSKSNQVQIYRLTAEKTISHIDFWTVYG